MPEAPRGGRIIDLSDALGGTELMAEQLEEISESVKKIMAGRLTEDAIVILIRELLPRGFKLGPHQIRAVLQAAQRLDDFVRKP
jgi:hypothetical protein